MSPAAIAKALSKLHLVSGDIIVCRDYELLKVIIEMEMPPGTPPCPVIYAPDGLDKINRSDLRAMLDQTEPDNIDEGAQAPNIIIPQ